MPLAQMALAFINSRNFLTANIIGATNFNNSKKILIRLNIRYRKMFLKEIEANTFRISKIQHHKISENKISAKLIE